MLQDFIYTSHKYIVSKKAQCQTYFCTFKIHSDTLYHAEHSQFSQTNSAKHNN